MMKRGLKVKVEAETIVETMPNGPLMVYGNVTVKDASGNLTKKNNVTAFCRCGASSNKPFCDGSHKRIGFEG
ncbi:MAG: CDGSH iron-sulfur domain-containing protein [Cytophagales bacterium]|nr:CDGSH iron-sulfur domain-containing protein [Cytophagales bacterium]